MMLANIGIFLDLERVLLIIFFFAVQNIFLFCYYGFQDYVAKNTKKVKL